MRALLSDLFDGGVHRLDLRTFALEALAGLIGGLLVFVGLVVVFHFLHRYFRKRRDRRGPPR